MQLNSLPEVAQENYLNKLNPDFDDVAVDFNGTTYFPWVTVFRDVKTSKWLGWFLHLDTPNSDHIFQTFYYAVQKFGILNDVYLDNGKDYRCKDFAGEKA